jgi:hypothetical protein
VASEPLRKPEDVRTLIGLATRKQGDQLIASFEAILKGRSLATASVDNPYKKEREEVEDDLNQELGGAVTAGAWWFSFHAMDYVAERWKDLEALGRLVDKHSVVLRNQFPPAIQFGKPAYRHGVGNSVFGTSFCMTRSGLFVSCRLFREDSIPLETQGEPNPLWLSFRRNIFVLTEFFLFLSRFATEFGPGVEIEYDVSAEPLRNRIMVERSFEINLCDSDPCRINSFQRLGRSSVEDLRSGWIDVCVEFTAKFLELFYGGLISHNAIRINIDNFMKRRF